MGERIEEISGWSQLPAGAVDQMLEGTLAVSRRCTDAGTHGSRTQRYCVERIHGSTNSCLRPSDGTTLREVVRRDRHRQSIL